MFERFHNQTLFGSKVKRIRNKTSLSNFFTISYNSLNLIHEIWSENDRIIYNKFHVLKIIQQLSYDFPHTFQEPCKTYYINNKIHLVLSLFPYSYKYYYTFSLVSCHSLVTGIEDDLWKSSFRKL